MSRLEIMLAGALAAVPSAWVSTQILLALGAVLIASSMMFWALVRRWTSHRQWVALSEWGREAGFRFRRCDAGPPEPLDALSKSNPIMRICLADRRTTILQLQADSPVAGAGPAFRDAATDGTLLPAGGVPRPVVWNLLIRRIESEWRPTGLRPTGPNASILDLFSLSSFPLMGPQERFVIFGTDSTAARALSSSPARALLPPDIGILVHGRCLLLDFSNRPFDSIELSRMLSVADQVASRLPATPDDAASKET